MKPENVLALLVSVQALLGPSVSRPPGGEPPLPKPHAIVFLSERTAPIERLR